MTDPTLASLMPSTPRRRRWPLIAIAAAIALLAAGLTVVAVLLVGRDAEEERPAAAATSAALEDQTTVIECTNVARAYTAWLQGDKPSSAAEAEALTSFHLETLMDDGKELLSQVQGYNDQPSKAFATAVAEYNLAVALANADAVIGSGVTPEKANELVGKMTAVQVSYSAFRTATCAGVKP